jgi:hypothetical protein
MKEEEASTGRLGEGGGWPDRKGQAVRRSEARLEGHVAKWLCPWGAQ